MATLSNEERNSCPANDPLFFLSSFSGESYFRAAENGVSLCLTRSVGSLPLNNLSCYTSDNGHKRGPKYRKYMVPLYLENSPNAEFPQKSTSFALPTQTAV